MAFLGDATPLGVADPDGGWALRLVRRTCARGHAVTPYVLGVRGETSEGLRERWRGEVERRLPDPRHGRLVVQTGAADAARHAPGGGGGDGPRVTPERSEANLAALVAVARRRWPLLVVGPAPVADPVHDGAVARLDERLAVVCGDLAVPYLRVHAALSDAGVWTAEVRAGDGRHAGAGGHAHLADLVGAWPSWSGWFASAEARSPRAPGTTWDARGP